MPYDSLHSPRLTFPDLDTLGRKLARTYVRQGFFQMFCLIDKLETAHMVAQARTCQRVFQDSHRDVDPRLLLLPWAEDRQCVRLWGCRPVRAWTSLLSDEGLLPCTSSALTPQAWRIYLNFLRGSAGMPAWIRLKRALDTERRLRRGCRPHPRQVAAGRRPVELQT